MPSLSSSSPGSSPLCSLPHTRGAAWGASGDDIPSPSADEDSNMMILVFCRASEPCASSAAFKWWRRVHLLSLSSTRGLEVLFLTVCTNGELWWRVEVGAEVAGRWQDFEPPLPSLVAETFTELSEDAGDAVLPSVPDLHLLGSVSLVLLWSHSLFVLLLLQASTESGG